MSGSTIISAIKLRRFRCSIRDVNVIYKVRGQPRRVTIFTINSRYTINTRTWINRSVFALDIPLWPRGRGDRSRINSRGIVRLYYVDEAALSKYPIPRQEGNFGIFRSIYRFTLFHFRGRSFRLFSIPPLRFSIIRFILLFFF